MTELREDQLQLLDALNSRPSSSIPGRAKSIYLSAERSTRKRAAFLKHTAGPGITRQTTC